MRIRGVVVMLALVAGSVAATLPAPACSRQAEPTVEQAVENEGVVGVVERRTLASSPFPWGASISVVTRIWGGIRADRWKVSDMRFNACGHPVRSTGDYELDFRGAEAEWKEFTNTIGSGTRLGGIDLLLVEAEFGAPESFAVGGVDRFMANIRVFGFEVTAGLVLIVLGIVSFLRRRIRKRYDRTLF